MRCDFVFWGAAALGGLVPVHGQDNTMRRPNILFCIADDAAWLHFGAYGCQWVSTPVFDSVTARGVLFENCYTPNANIKYIDNQLVTVIKIQMICKCKYKTI